MNLAFADQIKVNVAARNGIELSSLMQSNKTDEHRKLLQFEGTENGRDKIGPNVWVDTVDKWIELHATRYAKMGRPIGVVIVSDCRFPNEVDWIFSRGGIVLKMEAPKRNLAAMEKTGDPEKIKNHPSETSLDDYENENIIIVKNDVPNRSIDEQLAEALSKHLKVELQ